MLGQKVTNVTTLFLLAGILLVAGFATYWFLYIKSPVDTDAALNKAFTTEEGGAGFSDLEGNQMTLSDYFGDILVVTSWASWCPQCKDDLPALDRLASMYENIQVLAVNRAEDRFTAQRYLSTIEDMNNLTVILDADDHFFEAHEGYAMPETILYNRKGDVVLHQRGALNIEELNGRIEELLEQ